MSLAPLDRPMSFPYPAFPEWDVTICCCLEGVLVARAVNVALSILAIAFFFVYSTVVWTSSVIHSNLRIMLIKMIAMDLLAIGMWMPETAYWNGKVNNYGVLSYLRIVAWFFDAFSVLSLQFERFWALKFYKTYEKYSDRFSWMLVGCLISECAIIGLVMGIRIAGFIDSNTTSYVTLASCAVSLVALAFLLSSSKKCLIREEQSRFAPSASSYITRRFQMQENKAAAQMLRILIPFMTISFFIIVFTMLGTNYWIRPYYLREYLLLYSWYLCALPIRAMISMYITVFYHEELWSSLTETKAFAWMAWLKKETRSGRRMIKVQKIGAQMELDNIDSGGRRAAAEATTTQYFTQLMNQWGPREAFTVTTTAQSSMPSTPTSSPDDDLRSPPTMNPLSNIAARRIKGYKAERKDS